MIELDFTRNRMQNQRIKYLGSVENAFFTYKDKQIPYIWKPENDCVAYI
jgi:hypothetical protein